MRFGNQLSQLSIFLTYVGGSALKYMGSRLIADLQREGHLRHRGEQSSEFYSSHPKYVYMWVARGS